MKLGVLHLLLILSSLLSPATSSDCAATDCILSQWTDWSACSASCGDLGLQTRSRDVLAAAACGGGCTGQTTESRPCNRVCCPQNCEFTEWTSWRSCKCDSAFFYCDRTIPRISCSRKREKTKSAACGGYCSGLVRDFQCKEACCYKDCKLGG